MIADVTERTTEFLQACKEAGYENVAIFTSDRSVPISMELAKPKHRQYFGYGTFEVPYRVVCASPEIRGGHFSYRGTDNPAMWTVAERSSLLPGGGFGDSCPVHKSIIPTLTQGCYDLSDL